MSRTFHHGKRNNKEQHIRARGIKRSKPDLRRLGRALIELAEAELEKEARVQHKSTKPKKNRKTSS